ncbi:MAG: Gfo/Idh/MocA family oxidoreductase [Candidatus Tectomicrobia bacterium]|uniref:Gfo/Idh/MocA family oxidoreductase n=1 Tax=Tectimicrobiota bacterium TaxID=2528274 RepID=A0A932ZVM2_UNCTE|nr:Gfo/Idh/MocA family oxidoreductase [Candidatus Tectomicrobia bacterium]
MAFEPVRAASMGLGRWASVLADAALRGGRIRLVSCFSRTAGKRQEFSRRYGAREAGTFEEFLKDPEVEAVILTTPNHNHMEHIEALAAAGKHVYCEKPIAHSLEHARRIVQAAERAGVKLAIGHSARRLAPSRKLKELIDAGEIGEVSMCESNFSTERGLELTPDKWRSSGELNPTGVVIQLSIHHIDTLRYLNGPIKTVIGRLKRMYATAGVEDASMIVMEHANGVLSYVGGGWACPWAFHMNVHGTKGVAHFRLTGQQWRDPSKAPEPIRLRVDRDPLGQDTVHDMPGGDMFRDALEDFALCVREDRAPEVDGRAACEALAVVYAAAESSRAGKAVELGGFMP